MPEQLSIFEKGADRSILAYGAVIMCFVTILIGALAARSLREETMMRSAPPVPAKILEIQQVRGGSNVKIAFERFANGDNIACQTKIIVDSDHKDIHLDSIIEVVPRSDSCGEPAVVGPRNTTILVFASSASFLASLVLAALAAHSMMQSQRVR